MAIMGIKKSICVVMLLVCAVAAVGCQNTKKQAHYSDIYKEQPSTIYVAPIVDHSLRRAVRSTEDSAYNASLNTAAQQLFLTATDPLVNNGYYVPGPLASAQLAATEARTGRQLRNENLSDYAHDLGIDAILFITLNRWSDAGDGWTVEVEYVLRRKEALALTRSSPMASMIKRVGVGLVPSFTITSVLPGMAMKFSKEPLMAVFASSTGFLLDPPVAMSLSLRMAPKCSGATSNAIFSLL